MDNNFSNCRFLGYFYSAGRGSSSLGLSRGKINESEISKVNCQSRNGVLDKTYMLKFINNIAMQIITKLHRFNSFLQQKLSTKSSDILIWKKLATHYL